MINKFIAKTIAYFEGSNKSLLHRFFFFNLFNQLVDVPLNMQERVRKEINSGRCLVNMCSIGNVVVSPIERSSFTARIKDDEFSKKENCSGTQDHSLICSRLILCNRLLTPAKGYSHYSLILIGMKSP